MCTIDALTDSEIEVIMDHHLMLWVQAKSWDECRPMAGTKDLSLCYEDSFHGKKFAMIAFTEIELSEAFLDQEDEGSPDSPAEPDPDDDTLEDGVIIPVIVARPAPSIHDKGKAKGKDPKGKNPKGKGKGKRSESKGRSNTPGNPPLPLDRHTSCQPTGILLQLAARIPYLITSTTRSSCTESGAIRSSILSSN